VDGANWALARHRPPPQQHPRPLGMARRVRYEPRRPQPPRKVAGYPRGRYARQGLETSLSPTLIVVNGNVYYSHTAQAAHNQVQSKRDWKNPHGLYRGTRYPHLSAGEPSSSAPTHSVGLAARLSAAPVPGAASPAHGPMAVDADTTAVPLAPLPPHVHTPWTWMMPPVTSTAGDVGTDTSDIYQGNDASSNA